MTLKFIDSLGQGFTGEVWHAYDEELGRDVAVKFFFGVEDTLRDRVTDHARRLARIRHPNVVTVFGTCEVAHPRAVPNDRPMFALVMEYVPGMNFGEWARLDTVTSIEAVGVLSGIISGLEAFHEAGVPHGDLHEQNIRVSGATAKLIDPIARDPSIAMTTIKNKEALRRDLRWMRDLLVKGIQRFASDEQLGALAIAPTAELTFEEAHRLVGAAMSKNNRDESTEQSGFYDKCCEARDTTSVVRWQGLSKQVEREIPHVLGAWLQQHRGGFSQDEQWVKARTEGIVELEQFWALCLSAAEEGTIRLLPDAMRFLDLLSIDWIKSGQSLVVNYPHLLCHVGHNLVGAAICRQGHFEHAASMAERPVFSAHTGKAYALWKSPELMRPLGAGREVESGWKFLSGLYDVLDCAPRVFPTESAFRCALAEYRLVLTMIYFARCSVDELEQLKQHRQKVNLPYLIPPVYLFLREVEQQRVASRVLGSQEVVSSILEPRGSSIATWREYWPSWIDRHEAILGDGRSFGLPGMSPFSSVEW